MNENLLTLFTSVHLLFASLSLTPQAVAGDAGTVTIADQAARPIAFRGARIYTVAGAPIENGVLLVEKGKIVAVGSVPETPIPDRIQVIDLGG